MRDFFANKVVCITGSGQGIGKATAQLLGSFGAKLCINGRNAEKLKAAAVELINSGVECIEVVADLTDPLQCEYLITTCLAHYGRLDVLINNAGISSRGRITESAPKIWEHTMKSNFHSAVNTTYFALPHLLKSHGSVIMVSSIAAKVGIPGHAGYAASKMALTAYSKALQNEHSKSDIHCGLVFVGFTSNERTKQLFNPDGTYSDLPLRRGIKLSTREEVAQSIAKCIVRRQNQMTLSLLGKIQHIMLRLAPGIVYAILRKSYMKYDEMYARRV